MIRNVYHIKADDKKAEETISSEKEEIDQKRGIFDSIGVSTFFLDKQNLRLL